MAIDDSTSYELTGAQVKDLANKIKGKAADNTFVGATPAAPGSKGLVPEPQAGDNAKFLSGDGTWQTPPTVNNGALTIQQNGKTLGKFTANQSTNTTINLENSSYSTSEVKTSATWIDGKPIYKKTFSFTLANAEATTVNHGISNFGLLIRFEGAVVQSNTKNVPIPRTLTNLNYQIGLEGVTTTSFEIDVGTNGPRGKQAYITLWYTKTTD